MPKKVPLSWEEHEQLGAELKEIRSRLTKIAILVPNRVGLSTKAARRAVALLQAMNELKSEMDSVLFKAFPGEDSRVLADVYYGQPRESEH